MMIKVVLFDIDGTLVDSNDFHVEAWQEAFRTVGARFDNQTVHAQIGKGTDMLVPSLLPDLDEAARKKLGEGHATTFKDRFLSQVQPFPRAHELLVRVKNAGMEVVLASSASKEELEHYVDLLDARDLITATTTADDVKNTKPAPDIFATAMKKLAPLGVEGALVIGDSPYDIEAAANCGIAAIGMRSGGFTDETLLEAGAIALYDDVASLLTDFDKSPLTA